MIMTFLKYVFFFVLTLVYQLPTFAQNWVSYQSHQQVNDLVDTGYELLMATDAGLVVMNKSSLEKTIFNKANSNLSNNHIQTTTQAPNGDSWIGTYDVILARFNGTDFEDTTQPDHEEYDENTMLYDFEIAPNGDFWLGTSDGVFHRQNQTWLHYGEEELDFNSLLVWDIEIDADGVVFIASHYLYRYADGIWSNISDTTPLFAYGDADILLSQSGDLFLSGDLDRIGRFNGEQWQIFDTSEPEDFDVNFSFAQEISGFTEDIDGNVYLNAQNNGVYKLVDNTWTQQVDEQTEAFNNQTSYFHIDEQNNRWLNHNIYISVYENGNVQSTTISEHTIAYNEVHRIHKGNNGNLYFPYEISSATTYKNGVAVLSPDGNWSELQIPVSLILWPGYGDMLVLDDDDIWIAFFSGLYHFDGNDWTHHQLSPCSSFAVDTQGKIF